MSTSPTPARRAHRWATRRFAPPTRALAPLVLGVLSGCMTISDDEYAWRLKASEGGDGGGSGDDSSSDCEGEEQVFYADSDSDGFGDPQGATQACEQPDGTVTNADDCDDTDPAVALLVTWWLDSDGDGVGGDSSIEDCRAPLGYVSSTGDCEDADGAVLPGAPELCDGKDNDCDGLVDDDDPDVDRTGLSPQYVDGDGDGYGVGEGTVVSCELPSGYSLQAGDCDDDEANANPGLDEVCNDGIDNDCDGTPGECALDSEVDLEAADVTLTTSLSFVLHGEQVIAGGDLDGDGVGDLVLGAPGEEAVGAVYLVGALGSLAGDTPTGSAATSRLSPPESGGRLGHDIAALGDIDGDGVDDLLLGDPYDETVGARAGAAWIVPGPYPADASVDTVGVALLGESANAYAGWAVSSAGDMNGDSTTDLLVSAYRDGTVAPQAGSTYLVLGPVTADRSLSEADWTVQGSWQDRVGYSLAGAADVNGDGLPDVILGSDRSDPEGVSNAGTVAVFYGPVSGLSVLEDADARRTGTSASAFLGTAVASGGDLNGDGFDDVVMGSAGEGSGTVGGPGAAFVELGPLSGATGVVEADAWISGVGAGDSVGQSMDIVPDMNDDGADELFLGAPGTIGSSGLDDGAALLWLSVPSGGLDTSSADIVFFGRADSRAGASVGGAGDLNGDGQLDLLVGAPAGNQAHVIFGRGL